jgi:hypothetical protein
MTTNINTSTTLPPDQNDDINNDPNNPTITIEDEVYCELVELESKNETHNAAIKRLIDFYKSKRQEDKKKNKKGIGNE